jgi:molybdopterin molybdotransferase
MRPGKPLAFGHLSGTPIMGLPGNPVSSMVTFELFARPAMLRLGGHQRTSLPELRATALQSISNRSGRENFMRGVVEQRQAVDGEPEWTVRLTGEQGSNILTSMTKANALVRLPKLKTHFRAGERLRVLMLDWPPLW